MEEFLNRPILAEQHETLLEQTRLLLLSGGNPQVRVFGDATDFLATAETVDFSFTGLPIIPIEQGESQKVRVLGFHKDQHDIRESTSQFEDSARRELTFRANSRLPEAASGVPAINLASSNAIALASENAGTRNDHRASASAREITRSATRNMQTVAGDRNVLVRSISSSRIADRNGGAP